MTTDPQKGNGILKPFSWLWLAGAMLLGSYLILTSGNSTSANNAATNRDDTSHAAVDGGTTVKFDRPEGPESATRNIEDIRVGDRVLASNPEISEEERATWGEPDWSEWWHLSLQMPLATGDGHADVESKLLHIELLRPDFWVREHIGFVVDELPLVTRKAAHLADVTSKPPPVFDGVAAAQPESATGLPLVPLSSLRGVYRDIILASAVLETRDPDLVGLTVEMDLPEMGALGTATITDIKPCPAVRPGDGQVVTATFKHPPSTTVLDVTFIDETDSRSSSNLTSQASSVGVTDNHLFWSVDREAFVAIGEMALGERVVTYQGGTKRVAQKLPRPGPQLVYNLEVCGEHVYFVGEKGLLVHNSYARKGKGVLLGEFNPRVRTAAKAHGYRAWAARNWNDWVKDVPAGRVSPTAIKKNMRWLNDQIRRGESIYSLGKTPGFGRGDYYKKEVALLLKNGYRRRFNRMISVPGFGDVKLYEWIIP